MKHTKYTFFATRHCAAIVTHERTTSVKCIHHVSICSHPFPVPVPTNTSVQPTQTSFCVDLVLKFYSFLIMHASICVVINTFGLNRIDSKNKWSAMHNMYVRLIGVLLSVICTNTGVPQGTVLAPFLFSLYTADCISTDTNDKWQTQMVGKSVMMRTHCTTSRLKILWIGVIKNYTRKNQRCPKQVYIEEEALKKVETYQYLGVVFDSKLNWEKNTNSVLQKVNSRTYCLRKLRSFGVNSDMFITSSNAVICSLISLVLSVGVEIFQNLI